MNIHGVTALVTGELADGWIGSPFFPETTDVPLDPIRDGAARHGRQLADIDAAGRRHAEGYAFTFGAMGSPTRNSYNDAFERQGYGDDVGEVQRLWLTGHRDAARRPVPTGISLGTNPTGTDDLVRDLVRRYRDAGITMLRFQLQGDPTSDLDRQLADLAHLLHLVTEVNDEPAAHDTRESEVPT